MAFVKRLKQIGAWIVLRRIMRKSESGDWIGALEASGMNLDDYADLTLEQARGVFEMRVNGYLKDLIGKGE